MSVINQVSLPKGNTGMTLFGINNDDGIATLPDLGFNFNYNGVVIRRLYVSGNSWIGLGSTTEHLRINRRDASYNKLYYLAELEYNTKLFRVRFEGNSTYNSWGSNNIIWELSIFETGVMRLVIEKIPNNGTNNFVNPNVGTQSLILEQGKSYIFTPADQLGKNYLFQEGSYLPFITKFLIVDIEGVKNYQGTTWTKIGDLPLTEEMFNDFGVDNLTASMTGLVGTSPVLYVYTDNQEVKDDKSGNRFYIEKTVTSKPKLIIQDYDFIIHDGKSISKLEAIVQYTKKDVSLNDVATNGKIRIALSIDSGASWITYSISTSSFETIDILDTTMFLENGINHEVLMSIDYTLLNNLISENRKLRFSYILEKPILSDVCKLRKMKIFYN